MKECKDCRPPTKNLHAFFHDLEVESLTLEALTGHVNEGLYCRTVKFFGLIFRHDNRSGCSKRGLLGPNCIDVNYQNLFIADEDDTFHVFLVPPKEE